MVQMVQYFCGGKALYSNEMAGKRLHARATSVIWDLGGCRGNGSSTWLPISQAARYLERILYRKLEYLIDDDRIYDLESMIIRYD